MRAPTLLLSLMSVCCLLVCWAAGLLSHLSEPNSGDPLERIRSWGICEKALKQCQETMETFQGSDKTLWHIQRVEKALRRLITITN